MIYSEYPVEAASTLMRRVFAWMAIGLIITGLTAFGVNFFPGVQQVIITNPILFFILCIAQIGLVIYLSAGLRSMSAETAIFSYILYALLTGTTLSVIFIAFTLPSIATTFFVCAGMFAAMALYGALTKTDLSGMGSYLLMGLFGIILASIINLFMRNAGADFIISIAGVVIFTLLTAYDIQQIKRLGLTMISNEEDTTKVSIICALRLYLDFVNLFLYLLRFFGQKKN